MSNTCKNPVEDSTHDERIRNLEQVAARLRSAAQKQQLIQDILRMVQEKEKVDRDTAHYQALGDAWDEEAKHWQAKIRELEGSMKESNVVNEHDTTKK